MKKNKKIKILPVQEEIQSIGIDLNVAASLIKFLDAGMNGQFEIKKSDIENLISVINHSMQRIIEKQDNLENILEM